MSQAETDCAMVFKQLQEYGPSTRREVRELLMFDSYLITKRRVKEAMALLDLKWEKGEDGLILWRLSTQPPSR